MAPSVTPVNKSKSRPVGNLWLLSIVLSWLFACAMGFWWFEYRHWGAYPAQLVQFNPKAIQSLYSILNDKPESDVFLVHFKGTDCPCESYREAHVEDIQPLLTKINQMTVSEQTLRQYDVSIPASPAVAIWDSTGELAYFGPYSSGLTCGKGLDFISMTLKKLDLGNNPKWINTQGFGCFCPWQES
jgi:hypothetical protein